MKLRKPTAVALETLLNSDRLDDLNILHLGQGSNLVTGLKYVTDIEEISIANPDTALFITEGVGLGGWMVSAAIRIAWERKSAVLVVPDVSLSESVVELARRLDVTLVATHSSIATVALEFAGVLGAEQAGTVARVHTFVTRLSRTESLDEALHHIASELGIGNVSVTAGVASGDGVVASIPGFQGSESQYFLQASVPDSKVAYARELLSSVAPLIGLILALDHARKHQAAFPLLSVAALLGTVEHRATSRPPSDALLSEFGWNLDHAYVVCYITTPLTVQEQVLVQQRWAISFPSQSLVRVEGGWLAAIPVAFGDSYRRLLQQVSNCVKPLQGVADVRVGISELVETARQARTALHQAWLASLFTEPAEALSFASLQFECVSRIIPGSAALQLAAYFFPELPHAANRAELVATGLAFCNAFGSVARAAELTGVHRNTIQTRIARLEQLGVPFNDPTRALSTHMLLHALNHQYQEESERNT